MTIESAEKAIWLLPKCLMGDYNSPDPKALPILEMMLTYGLNREEKKRIAKKHVPGENRFSDLISIPELDRKLLSYYCDPYLRYFGFWSVFNRLKKSGIKTTPGILLSSVDYFLLNAYVGNLANLKFDEDKLKKTCPIWDEVSQRLGKLDEKFHPEVFMIWLQAVKDISTWDLLSQEKRTQLSNVIFSLSSISLTDWFVREAIRLCPDLLPEYDDLLTTQKYAVQPKSSENNKVPIQDVSLQESSLITDGKNESVSKWIALTDRLTDLLALMKESQDHFEQVTHLKEICLDFEKLSLSLSKANNANSQFDERLLRLTDSVRSITKEYGNDFAWLDESLIDQISARWKKAHVSTVSESEADRLNDDFTRASRVGSEKIACYRSALRDIYKIRAEIESADVELAEIDSSTKRRALQQKKIEKKNEETRVELSLQTFEVEVLSAYSPWGDSFDFSIDYACFSSGVVSIAESSPQVTLPQISAIVPVEASEPASCRDNSGVTDAKELKMSLDQMSSLEKSKPVKVIPLGESEQTVSEFSPAAGELCRPLWMALFQGRISLAYHVAKILENMADSPPVPSSHLLASVVLSEVLVLPDGGVSSELERCFTQISETSVPSGAPDAWKTAINLLLAASTMRPILLSPRSGAAAVARRNLHLDARHQSIYQLIELLLSYSDRLQGFRIEEATFKGAKSHAAWQHDIDLLTQDIRDWVLHAPNMTMKYAAASKVWYHWQRNGGVIANLLSPASSNSYDRVNDVKLAIAALGDLDGVIRQIHHTDRNELGRRKGEEIHTLALGQIVRRVEEAVALARRWVVLVESRPHASDVLGKLLNQLRAEFIPVEKQVLHDLATELEGDPWGLIAAARKAVVRSLASLADLFDPEKPGKVSEPLAEEVLGHDLLFVAEINLTEEWQPETTGEEFLGCVSNALAAGFDVRQAFSIRIGRHDLDGAERICRTQEAEIDGELKADLMREVGEHQRMMRQKLDEVRSEIEMGLAYGFITEAERAAFDGQLVYYESKAEQVRRFGEVFSDLEAIADTILKRRKEKTIEIQRRLNDIASHCDDPLSIEVVQQCINSGDVLSANEFLQRIENHESLQSASIDAPNRFVEYFPKLANSIDSSLEENDPNQLRKMVRNAENFGGLDFSKVPGGLAKQAGDMVSLWLDIKARKNVDRESLFKLIQLLGFGVLEVNIGQAIGSRIECELKSEIIEDRAICPIPYFGSNAIGRYRVICVWQRPAEDDLVKLAGDSTISKPTIVLYFGRLTERKRRETSRLAKLNHRSFLLIDESMLVYLTAEPRSRLAALFEVSLPFTYSTPYDATSSVVPTEMFFGRALELQSIQGQNGRCFIYGGRQLGKTALLRKAERSFHSPANGRFGRWIDLQAEGVGVNKDPSEIWLCISREFKRMGVIPEETADPNPNVKGRVENFIELLKQSFSANSNRRVLLLLDEADRFFDRDGQNNFQETARLKGLMEDSNRCFKVVFAGLHNVLRMTEQANHPLAHLGEPIKVGPLLEGLEWRDAEDLIRKPFEASGFEFESRSLITRILAQTNYYPSLIQLYCAHLLRQMLSVVKETPNFSGPRYLISAKHVDAAYRNRDLRDEIRTKFQLTLQLDPRYEVIAYTLAYDALDGRGSLIDGIRSREIKEKVITWWPEGFTNTSDLEFRVLLDEMVGLGVLRQTRDGWFSLRNPNVLLLLGTHDEIDEVLVKERELPQEFEPNAFRSRLLDDSANLKRDPLTFQQLSLLRRQKNGVTVLSGCAAAGFDDVELFLKRNVSDGFLIIPQGSIDRIGFLKILDGLKDRKAGGTTVIVVTSVMPWNKEWLNDASDYVSKLGSKDKFAHILFLSDATTTYHMINDASSNAALMNVSGLSLHPWQDAFLRQWLEDGKMPNDPPNRRSVSQQTGNWPALLYILISFSTDGNRLSDHLSELQEYLSDPNKVEEVLSHFGLNILGPREVLKSLATLGEPTSADDLASVGDFNPDKVEADLRWAELLGIARRAGGDCWMLDPIVQQLLNR